MSAKLGLIHIVYVRFGVQKVLLNGVAGCSLFRGCLSIEAISRQDYVVDVRY